MWQTGRSTWRPRNTWWRQETRGDGDFTVRKEGKVCPEKWAVAWCQPGHHGNWTAKNRLCFCFCWTLGSAETHDVRRSSLLLWEEGSAQTHDVRRSSLLLWEEGSAQTHDVRRSSLLLWEEGSAETHETHDVRRSSLLLWEEGSAETHDVRRSSLLLWEEGSAETHDVRRSSLLLWEEGSAQTHDVRRSSLLLWEEGSAQTHDVLGVLFVVYSFVNWQKQTNFGTDVWACCTDKVMTFCGCGSKTYWIINWKSWLGVCTDPRRTGKVKPPLPQLPRAVHGSSRCFSGWDI